MSFYCRVPYKPQVHNQAQLEVWIEQHLDVRNQGREEWNCVCPFHQAADTRRPDMYINVTKGVYHCLSSSCGVQGHILDLVRRLTGGSWEDARRAVGRPGVEALGRLLNALRPPPQGPPLSLSWDEVLAHRSSHYWTSDRGISQVAQDHFMLGFDHSRNQALIPYIDEHREPRCFLRRQMLGHPKYLYPEQFEAERAWYHLYECRPDEPLIVVEGSIDAMRIWESGHRNVVAILGSETPPDKGRMIRHHQIISFLDADTAGVVGTWKLKEAVGRMIQRVTYPDSLQGMDPGKLTNEQIEECLSRLAPVW